MEKLAKSTDGPTVATAVKSLREFARIPDSIIHYPASQALSRLEKSASKWGAKYQMDGAPQSLTFCKVGLKHKHLVHIHVLQPKSVAFVDMNNFNDFDLLALDLLDSLENLTIQNCPNFEGTAFKSIRLPRLKIIHLNGSGTNGIRINEVNRENFPNLIYMNLRNTKSKRKWAIALKARMDSESKGFELVTH